MKKQKRSIKFYGYYPGKYRNGIFLKRPEEWFRKFISRVLGDSSIKIEIIKYPERKWMYNTYWWDAGEAFIHAKTKRQKKLIDAYEGKFSVNHWYVRYKEPMTNEEMHACHAQRKGMTVEEFDAYLDAECAKKEAEQARLKADYEAKYGPEKEVTEEEYQKQQEEWAALKAEYDRKYAMRFQKHWRMYEY